MSNRSLLFSLSALCALTLALSQLHAADKKADLSKLPPASKQKGVTYAKDIQPILEKACVKCHSGDRPKGKYRMDSLAALIKGGESGEPAVVPGHSDQSPLALYPSDAVVDMEMPPTEKRDKFPALTKEQIALVRAWIDQGAK
jgi:hypothetical protein